MPHIPLPKHTGVAVSAIVIAVVLTVATYIVWGLPAGLEKNAKGDLSPFADGKLWLWLAALVPMALVIYQLVQIRSLKPTPLKPEGSRFADVSRVVNARTEELYNHWTLTWNYGVPALLNLVTGLMLAYIVCTIPSCCGKLSEEVQMGVRLGGLGAYVYVVMMLSNRSFQQDVTPGAALWSAVNLLLGPILGGTVAVLLTDSVQTAPFSRQVLYFFAGLAPRQIIAVIGDVVRRMWSERGGPAYAPKLIPLNKVRGITPQIEDRLSEEGIADANVLAMANPLRLQRNTPFDDRQLFAWIDEAFLMSVLPESYAALQREGVTGAIDLAYYHVMFKGDEKKKDEAIQSLSTRTKIDVESLRDVIRRLFDDQQVQLIWTLYQAGKE